MLKKIKRFLLVELILIIPSAVVFFLVFGLIFYIVNSYEQKINKEVVAISQLINPLVEKKSSIEAEVKSVREKVPRKQELYWNLNNMGFYTGSYNSFITDRYSATIVSVNDIYNYCKNNQLEITNGTDINRFFYEFFPKESFRNWALDIGRYIPINNLEENNYLIDEYNSQKGWRKGCANLLLKNNEIILKDIYKSALDSSYNGTYSQFKDRLDLFDSEVDDFKLDTNELNRLNIIKAKLNNEINPLYTLLEEKLNTIYKERPKDYFLEFFCSHWHQYSSEKLKFYLPNGYNSDMEVKAFYLLQRDHSDKVPIINKDDDYLNEIAKKYDLSPYDHNFETRFQLALIIFFVLSFCYWIYWWFGGQRISIELIKKQISSSKTNEFSPLTKSNFSKKINFLNTIESEKYQDKALKKDKIDDVPFTANHYWKNARWGIIIFCIIHLIFEIGMQNRRVFVLVIINYWISAWYIKKQIKLEKFKSYPLLKGLAVSFVVFLIRILLGILIISIFL